ncbi:MAG: hypothetical protein R8G66_04810 [Cytophagales bacterium]|nr:hypothetical protein [Cytophagales bacterium]
MKLALELFLGNSNLSYMITKAIQQINSTHAIVAFLIACIILCASSEVFGTSIRFDHQFNITAEGSVSQIDSLEAFVNRDILVIQRYGGTKRKWVKKGTLMKVFVIPFPADSVGLSYEKSFLSGKDVYRGHFVSLVGDTLTLIRSGKELKFDIDNLHQVKVYNDIGARVFGDMVNTASFVSFGYSGLLFGVGVVWTQSDEAFSNAFSGPLMAAGVVLGGLSYLLHRLGLVIRRNKYDLINDWYIVRTF